jgi:uncharacterized cupredoxin-like copper-binding protein
VSSKSTSKDRVAFLAAIGFIAIVALLMAILALGRALAGGASAAPFPPLTAATTTTAAPSAPAVVTVHLSEFSVSPEAITLGRDGSLSVTNMGSIEHDVSVEGTDFATPLIAPGDTVDLDLTGLAPGDYRILCTVAGHDAAGMTAALIVTAEPGSGEVDPGEDHGTVDWEAMAANMQASIEAFPAATEGTGGLAFEPTILPDGTKEFSFVVEEIDWEVEPGRVVKGIAYNGQIPWPDDQGGCRRQGADRCREPPR